MFTYMKPSCILYVLGSETPGNAQTQFDPEVKRLYQEGKSAEAGALASRLLKNGTMLLPKSGSLPNTVKNIVERTIRSRSSASGGHRFKADIKRGTSILLQIHLTAPTVLYMDELINDIHLRIEEFKYHFDPVEYGNSYVKAGIVNTPHYWEFNGKNASATLDDVNACWSTYISSIDCLEYNTYQVMKQPMPMFLPAHPPMPVPMPAAYRMDLPVPPPVPVPVYVPAADPVYIPVPPPVPGAGYVHPPKQPDISDVGDFPPLDEAFAGATPDGVQPPRAAVSPTLPPAAVVQEDPLTFGDFDAPAQKAFREPQKVEDFEGEYFEVIDAKAGYDKTALALAEAQTAVEPSAPSPSGRKRQNKKRRELLARLTAEHDAATALLAAKKKALRAAIREQRNGLVAEAVALHRAGRTSDARTAEDEAGQLYDLLEQWV